MPMYFPDLKSVQQLAKNMARNKGSKKYMGTIPRNEDEVPQARTELAEYMRRV